MVSSGAVVALFLVLAAGVVLLWPLYHFPLLPQDEGTLLVYPELWIDGVRPQRDFECPYGPANFFLLAQAFRLWEPSVFVEQTVGLLYRVLLAGSIGWLARRQGVVVAGLLALLSLSCALLPPTTLAAFAWTGAASFFVAGLAAGDLGDRSSGSAHEASIFTVGLLAGSAISFRPDLGVAIGAALLPFVTRANRRDRWWIAIGLTSGLLLLLVHLANASPSVVFNGIASDGVRALQAGRRLPLSSLDQGRLGFLSLLYLSAAIAAVFAVRAFRRKEQNWRITGATAIFCIGCLPQATQRADWFHLGMVGAVVLPLGGQAVAGLAGSWLGRGGRTIGMALYLGMLAFVAKGAAIQSVADGWKRGLRLVEAPLFQVEHAGRRVPLSSPAHVRDVELGIGLVRSFARPGDRLIVAPADLLGTPANETYLYFLLPDLVPASYHLEMNPGVSNHHGSLLASDILNADFVLLSHSFALSVAVGDGERVGMRAPIETLLSRFTLIGRAGSYELWQRSS